jgi:hypothetical protein
MSVVEIRWKSGTSNSNSSTYYKQKAVETEETLKEWFPKVQVRKMPGTAKEEGDFDIFVAGKLVHNDANLKGSSVERTEFVKTCVKAAAKGEPFDDLSEELRTSAGLFLLSLGDNEEVKKSLLSVMPPRDSPKKSADKGGMDAKKITDAVAEDTDAKDTDAKLHDVGDAVVMETEEKILPCGFPFCCFYYKSRS